jgi:potassium-transporting ATPase KdpC subunit
MLNQLRPAVVLLLAFTLLTGLAYPYAITGLAHFFFPHQAEGSLIVRDGKVVGSELIGQNFADPKYFHGRPSATTDTDPNDSTKTVSVPYKADASTGSNLGPTSQALIDRVKADTAALQAEKPGPVPVDLVTSSASGLDPDITPAAAEFQIDRVARARGVTADKIRQIVARNTEARTFGVIGEPRVNVLELNLALDEAAK